MASQITVSYTVSVHGADLFTATNLGDALDFARQFARDCIRIKKYFFHGARVINRITYKMV